MHDTPQPAIFISHGGGPWPWMDDADTTWGGLKRHLAGIPALLPRPPDAAIVVTAHWETPTVNVSAGPTHPLLFDYGGFPPHTYELRYPAPGAPEIAERVVALAAAADIAVASDTVRGWDHGVFVPASVMWPGADVPIVAMSLRAGLDPRFHLDLGAALAPLRDENVVVIGSGLSMHDLSFRITPSEATEFDDWLDETMNLDPRARRQRLAAWASAPGGRAAHPREEHLLPLHVVTGAGRDDTVRRTYRDEMFGLPVAGYTFSAR